jgi:hypothetical protein
MMSSRRTIRHRIRRQLAKLHKRELSARWTEHTLTRQAGAAQTLRDPTDRKVRAPSAKAVRPDRLHRQEIPPRPRTVLARL